MRIIQKYIINTRLLSRRIKYNAGRNDTGTITVFSRGGRLKRKYRFIDYWRRLELQGVVLRLLKDSFRTTNIALVLYSNGLLSYILAVEGLYIGKFIFSGFKWFDISNFYIISQNPFDSSQQIPIGNTILLGLCPLGVEISNLELFPGKGGQLCRAAGTFCMIVKKFDINVVVKLKSGWCMLLHNTCMATIGMMSNIQHQYFIYRKAGFMRNLGWRPHVRGVAMNPIDHPHGGGEGKASGGKKLVTPWGVITKGYRTVSKKRRFLKSTIRFKEFSLV